MRVAFRTEGGHERGLGDVSGALALADELSLGGAEILFVLSGDAEAFAMVEGRRYRCARANEVGGALREFGPDVLVVIKLSAEDGELEALLRACGRTHPLLVTVDDSGPNARIADVRINALYEPHPLCGSGRGRTITDAGYVSLRSEFVELHLRERTIPDEPRSLLILQGGADTHGFLPRIVEALDGIGLQCTLATGPAFRHQEVLSSALSTSRLDVQVVHAPDNLAELMCSADIAITAAGLSLFELACVGTPCVIVAAERFENETAQRFADAGAALNLGFGGDLDFARLAGALCTLHPAAVRQHMSQTCKGLVDGRGSARTAELLRTLTKEKTERDEPPR